MAKMAANNICGIDVMHIARQGINLATNNSQTNVFSSKTNVIVAKLMSIVTYASCFPSPPLDTSTQPRCTSQWKSYIQVIKMLYCI